jgi:DNA-binding MarR family transcriptional regulator
MLVLLERRGLVERETHPTDARARTVALTAKGKRTFRRLWTAGEPIRAEMLGVLPGDEARVLVELLTRVARTLNPEAEASGRPTTSDSSEDEA